MRKHGWKRWLCLSAAVLLLLLAACSGGGDLQGTVFDRHIAMVKDGSPVLIPEITYGDAYDHFFANPQWRGFTADDDSQVVEFSGECYYLEEEATVYIQFVVDDEEGYFDMYYVSIQVGDEKWAAGGEMFIDLVYTPFASYSEEVLGKELDPDVQQAFSDLYDAYMY